MVWFERNVIIKKTKAMSQSTVEHQTQVSPLKSNAVEGSASSVHTGFD